MSHRTVFVPMLVPKLSDQAAAHLIDILEQFLGIAQHHYGDQARRWHARQRQLACARNHIVTRKDDDPF